MQNITGLPRAAIVSIALACSGSAALAADLAQPEGDVILTVSGELAATNVGDTAQFDRAMLEELGLVTITTSTIWTEGEQEFSGPSLKALTDLLGIEEGTLTATAVNDYAVEIPVSDAVEDGPILALDRNGEPMSVRDKGPIWVVYPYDANPDYQSEVHYSRSIWQLDRLGLADGS
ncbi:Oxidoreductase molybdopterin binding domain protein [Roseivivax sp. THAF40]|uniref:molybdopterin-dependent oxidoreductase n=1 Tax=unclassified Roseivivax TaxID=2639302 RepID=UPI0012693C4B|nr:MULTISPECIES: molybdopterin-dependent oxidoreductase [unclassified Roseivivax]QFS83726.1 Oxidoreductase molybdopterin binding domain protein [Roseivivax sp. THAF197b]QFT47528.1 Oxidoreductase molybdopterin binding domain protein [Roseivivax sp. THAF40]